MSTPTLSQASPPILNGRSIKINKPRKIVVLKLQPDLLAEYLPKPVPRSNSKAKSSPSLASTPNNLSTAAPVPQTSSTEEASESNSTPVPNTDQTTDETSKKGSTKGPKPGSKRGLGHGSESMPKPRGKPGPKKKPRL
jgi:INO80 complex subunit Ies4